MENLDLYYNRLIDSLKLLALPYNEQKKKFESFVDTPFEIIDVFDNNFKQLPKLIEKDVLSNIQIAEIIRLNNLIDFTLTNPKFKDLEEEQFANAPEWNNIRLFAKEILQLFIKKS